MIVPARRRHRRRASSASSRRNRLNRFLHVHLALAFVGGSAAALHARRRRAARRRVGAAGRAVLPVALVAAARTELRAWRGRRVPAALHAAGRRAGRGWPARPPASRRFSYRRRMLLVVPAALSGGLTPALAGVAAAAAGCTLALAVLGLAVGFWVRDHVRGLLSALGALVRAAVRHRPAAARAVWRAVGAGAPRPLGAPAHAQPARRLRVTVLFGIEHAARRSRRRPGWPDVAHRLGVGSRFVIILSTAA